MICRDPLLGLLRQQGYNVVRLPRTGLNPLQVLARQGTNLQPLGVLSMLVESDELPPAIVPDTTVSNLGGNDLHSGSVSVDLGLGFLGNILAAIGSSNAGLESVACGADTLRYTFRDLRQDAVAIAELDRYLGRARVHPDARQMCRLLEQDAIYVTTTTLKCSTLNIEVVTKPGKSLALDIPAIQGQVEGRVVVTSESESRAVLTYHGVESLVFGFQAVQLEYRGGDYRGFRIVEPGTVAMRSVEAAPVEQPAESDPSLVVFDMPGSSFVRLNDVADNEAPGNEPEDDLRASEGIRKHALLVGINAYPHVRPLGGCVNDVEAMRTALVERFGFQPDDVEVLTDAQASRDAMLAAFDRLADRTAAGDVVFFQYSGHGSQMTDREGDEPDGMDETIVPFDSGRDPYPNRDITDDEIFAWLRRLAARTDNITLVFDCCHSGTIDRDPFGEADRGIEPDTRPPQQLPPSPLDAETLEVLTAMREGAATRSANGREARSVLPPADSYVLIAGCLDTETAKELGVTQPTGKRLRHGALTYHLIRMLGGIVAGATYRDLFEKAAAGVTAEYADQHPQLVGSGDRELFGTRHVRPSRYVRVVSVDGEELELAAGAAHGVQVGSRWIIGVPGQKAPDEQAPLAKVEVTSVSAVTSQARVLEMHAAESLEAGCRAYEVEGVVPQAGVTAHACDRTGTEGGRESVQVMRLAIQDMSLDPSQPCLVRPANDEASADFRIDLLPAGTAEDRGGILPQLNELKQVTWSVTGRDGRIAFPPVAARVPRALDKIVDNLAKSSRYRAVLGITNTSRANPLAGKVDLILLRKAGEAWREAGPDGGGLVRYKEGDPIAFRIINATGGPVYATIVELGMDCTIAVLFPPAGSQPMVQPGAFDHGTGGTTKISLYFPAGIPASQAEGVDYFKLFATTEPTDFSVLSQDALRGKDAPSVTVASTLDRLLSSATLGTRNTTTRVPPNLAWATVERSVTLKR